MNGSRVGEVQSNIISAVLQCAFQAEMPEA